MARIWRVVALAMVGALSCGDGGEPGAGPIAPVLASTAPCAEPAFVGGALGLRCGRLVDARGRVVALRGVNARVDGIFDVSFADGRTALEPVPALEADDLTQMRDWGFDSLRLPINWSGVEPTRDGGFDEAYLDRVARALDLAQAAGLVVLVDFHQDAYSKEIGEDGAPLWAIEPPPSQLLGGPLQDLEARRLSPDVKAAFGTFWGDGAAGVALRARFAAMAGHVAARLGAHPAVAGFELFNEPVFATPAQLQRFHEEAFAAVRAAAPDRLVFFEPPAERNFLDAFPVGDLTPLGPGTVYSPHIYKYAFTKFPASAGRDTLAAQNLSAVDEARAWQAGLAFTEWGYDPRGERAEEYLTWQSELQEQAQASSFLWLWKEQSQGSWGGFDLVAGVWQERTRLRQILARVRPAAVAGWPKEYRFDRATGAFSLTFVADPTATGPTEIAVALALGAPLAVACDGQPVSAAVDAAGRLPVRCGEGSSTEHTITVRVTPRP